MALHCHYLHPFFGPVSRHPGPETPVPNDLLAPLTGRWTGLSRQRVLLSDDRAGHIACAREAEMAGLFLSRSLMRRAGGLWQAAVIDVAGEVVGGGLGVYPERGGDQLGVGAVGQLGQAGAA